MSMLFKTKSTPRLKEPPTSLKVHRLAYHGGSGSNAVAKDLSDIFELSTKVKEKDSQGNTPLHHAAARNHASLAEKFIEAGAPVNSQNNVKDTPLHLAARHGSLETVRVLLDQGNADVTIRDHKGYTALHTVGKCGNVEIAKLLVSHGADRTAKGENGKTPHDVARAGKHHELDHFYDQGWQPSKASSERSNPLTQKNRTAEGESTWTPNHTTETATLLEHNDEDDSKEDGNLSEGGSAAVADSQESKEPDPSHRLVPEDTANRSNSVRGSDHEVEGDQQIRTENRSSLSDEHDDQLHPVVNEDVEEEQASSERAEEEPAVGSLFARPHQDGSSPQDTSTTVRLSEGGMYPFETAVQVIRDLADKHFGGPKGHRLSRHPNCWGRYIQKRVSIADALCGPHYESPSQVEFRNIWAIIEAFDLSSRTTPTSVKQLLQESAHR
eukprot:gb/GECG01004877.1/.p1 GENE.gb/GECG01004877.1/~~gb/GECG01004877.1/.p1  ORF type:complete len:440 (+),score=60.87 gb/GECG01004877.1/:1-1320(+)